MNAKERPLKECANPNCSELFHPKGRQIYCQSSCNPGTSAYGRLRHGKEWPELDTNRREAIEIPCSLTPLQIASSQSKPYHLKSIL